MQIKENKDITKLLTFSVTRQEESNSIINNVIRTLLYNQISK